MRFNGQVRNITVVAFNKSIATEITARLGNPRLLPPQSPEQAAICRAVAERNEHIVVQARAGTGKTTAIEHIVAMYPAARAEAKTLHSLGFGALRYHLRKFGTTDPEINQDKVKILVEALLDAECPTAEDREKADAKIVPTCRLVSLCKSQGFLAFRPEPTDDDLRFLADRYDVDMPVVDDMVAESDVFDLTRRALVANNRQYAVIDYDDMVYLPLVLRCNIYPIDLIVCDEWQDMNDCQMELVKKAANGRGQIVVVGDDRQAIYGFRGANAEAMQTAINNLKARVMPLTVCRRCPTLVLDAAREIVADIQAAPGAIEGSIGELANWDDMIAAVGPDDLVLCRTTAPLVEACLRTIRQGKAATVKGRDIGKGLQLLLAKVRKNRRVKGMSILDALDSYRNRQLENMKEDRKQAFIDKIETLVVLSEGCNQWEAVARKIEDIFSAEDAKDTAGMVVFSTAHKAKGLEADNVYVIRPELMPGPWAKQAWQVAQEMNLRYVAITRAKRALTWVQDDRESKGREVAEVSRPKRKTRKAAPAAV